MIVGQSFDFFLGIFRSVLGRSSGVRRSLGATDGLVYRFSTYPIPIIFFPELGQPCFLGPPNPNEHLGLRIARRGRAAGRAGRPGRPARPGRAGPAGRRQKFGFSCQKLIFGVKNYFFVSKIAFRRQKFGFSCQRLTFGVKNLVFRVKNCFSASIFFAKN